eukprot:gene22116-28636_t
MAKIQNPQQPVVNSALKAPTLEMVQENLKSFLIPYVGDKADTVIKGLTNAQKFYYEANFDEIQKELLKRIEIPTNIQSYSANLKMVLASDKNRSNLSVLEPQPPNTKSKAPKITPTTTIQTPAQRKTRPLTPYFTAAAKSQNPPRLIKSASLSSPRKNLKRTMTRPKLNPALFNPALVSELGGFDYENSDLEHVMNRNLKRADIKTIINHDADVLTEDEAFYENVIGFAVNKTSNRGSAHRK